jgi:hypothetical protein
MPYNYIKIKFMRSLCCLKACKPHPYFNAIIVLVFTNQPTTPPLGCELGTNPLFQCLQTLEKFLNVFGTLWISFLEKKRDFTPTL